MSPEKQTRSAPAARLRGGHGLALECHERTRTEVVDERELVATCDRGELVHPRLLREADLPEVGLVDAKQERRLRADRRLVVGGARAVRRPHFPEAGAGAGEDVGDAKAVADLDQLAARDEHVAPVGERGEGEQHGARVVVHHERALRAGEPPQETGQMMLTRAARTLGEVVLQVRVAEGDTGDAVDGRLGERRAAEVRVHQHARGVQDAAELRPADRLELGERPVDEVSGVDACPDLLARALERRSSRIEHRRARLLRKPLVPEQLVHGGQVAKPHETQCKQGCLLNY